jgi:hypothetical protein
LQATKDTFNNRPPEFTFEYNVDRSPPVQERVRVKHEPTGVFLAPPHLDCHCPNTCKPGEPGTLFRREPALNLILGACPSFSASGKRGSGDDTKGKFVVGWRDGVNDTIQRRQGQTSFYGGH